MPEGDASAGLAALRSDLAELVAYETQTDGANGSEGAAELPDKLDANECPFDLPAALKQELARYYERAIAANRYPDGSHASLKRAIAAYASESAAASISPDSIALGHGSDELIRSLLIATCLGRPSSVLVAQPTFAMYGIIARTLGVPVVSVGRTESDFAIDLAAAQRAIAEAREAPVRVVFVAHPNSPTGNLLSAAELDWLRSLPERILVAIDEAYFEFSQHSLAGELAQRPNWIVLRTFSKAFRLATHRVGYGIAHPQPIAALEKIRLPYNLSGVAQAAAQFALDRRQQLLAAVPTIQSERERLRMALEQIPNVRVWPSAANFLYLRPTPPPSAAAVASALQASGTLARHTGGGIRLSVGSRAQNERALARLQAALQAHSSAPTS